MYWVKRHDHPYPDFDTEHKCRDFEAVRRRTSFNQVVLLDGVTIIKPEDAAEMLLSNGARCCRSSKTVHAASCDFFCSIDMHILDNLLKWTAVNPSTVSEPKYNT